MNIEQIKSDLNNGVIVSAITWRKLVEAALMMEEGLQRVASHSGPAPDYQKLATAFLKKVEAL